MYFISLIQSPHPLAIPFIVIAAEIESSVIGITKMGSFNELVATQGNSLRDIKSFAKLSTPKTGLYNFLGSRCRRECLRQHKNIHWSLRRPGGSQPPTIAEARRLGTLWRLNPPSHRGSTSSEGSGVGAARERENLQNCRVKVSKYYRTYRLLGMGMKVLENIQNLSGRV